MTDPTDNVNTSSATSQTYSSETTANTDTSYIGDSTYGAYEDDNVSEPTPRKTSDAKSYVDSSTDGVMGYSPTERPTAVAIKGGQGCSVSNSLTGVHDEEVQYRTSGALRHHWERVTPQGSFFLRDVDVFDNGTKSVHREYSDPTTGKNYLHEYQY